VTAPDTNSTGKTYGRKVTKGGLTTKGRGSILSYAKKEKKKEMKRKRTKLETGGERLPRRFPGRKKRKGET